MNKKFAFTLAEILITLSIIGVISALTMPALISDYRKEAQTVQIRKASQELANAVDMYITAEGKTSLASTGIFKGGGINSFVTSNLKILKTCSSNDTSCFAPSYRSITGNSGTVSCGGNSYVLANSAAICINVVGQNDGRNEPFIAGRPYLTVLMDTNGTKGPNIGGRDMFTFYIDKQGTVSGEAPAAVDNLVACKQNESPALCQNSCTKSAMGRFCYSTLEAANWEMNY